MHRVLLITTCCALLFLTGCDEGDSYNSSGSGGININYVYNNSGDTKIGTSEVLPPPKDEHNAQ